MIFLAMRFSWFLLNTNRCIDLHGWHFLRKKTPRRWPTSARMLKLSNGYGVAKSENPRWWSMFERTSTLDTSHGHFLPYQEDTPLVYSTPTPLHLTKHHTRWKEAQQQHYGHISCGAWARTRGQLGNFPQRQARHFIYNARGGSLCS